MTIDKQKLQKLLWAEAASYRADCADWKRNTEALQEFLGEKTLEEVALELLAENERLQSAARTLGQLRYTDNGGELWKPPLGEKPNFNLVDQLKAEVDSLTREADRQYTTIEAYRKDAERFQWLLKNASIIFDKKAAYQAETGFIKFDTMPGRTETASAIDAAMSKGEQP
jgi:hypothetical protein